MPTFIYSRVLGCTVSTYLCLYCIKTLVNPTTRFVHVSLCLVLFYLIVFTAPVEGYFFFCCRYWRVYWRFVSMFTWMHKHQW